MLVELQFLISAHRLIVFYVCTKFNENISKDVRVIERTRFMTDKQMDIQTDRQLWEELEVSLKKIIVEGYRAVGSLNDSFHFSNCLLLLLFFIDCGQW